MKTFTAAALASIFATVLAQDLHTISRRQGQNLASFTEALGGFEATPIECSGNPDRQFQVGGDTFVGFGAAAQRSCDQQQNKCANAANSGADFAVSDCGAQQQACTAAQQTPAGSCDGAAAAEGNEAAGNNNNNNNNNQDQNNNNQGDANANANANDNTCGGAKRRRDISGNVL